MRLQHRTAWCHTCSRLSLIVHRDAPENIPWDSPGSTIVQRQRVFFACSTDAVPHRNTVIVPKGEL